MSSRMQMLPVGLILLGAAVACASKSSSGAAAASRTFAEQAAAGSALFGEHCAKCHGDAGQGGKGPRLVGIREGALPLDPPADRKVRKTRFVTVGDVADFVMNNMPPTKPGSLSQDEYLAILAFDLQANGIQLGSKLTPEIARTTTIPR
jgi:mono/diheme cytochrome c family protein